MEKILANRLKKGDTVGLVTPSGVITPKKLNTAVKQIKALGYNTYFKPSVLSGFGYMAGGDKARAEELMHMFMNNKVDAVWCIRGGYGATRIIDLLDYGLIQQNPKLFIGYSDITALHTAILKKTGLVSYHGPMGGSEFNAFSINQFTELLTTPEETYIFPYKREPETKKNSEFDVYTINPGRAEGELIGGNLNVLNALSGTDFEPNFQDKIVFLEEIDERPYKVDRMLTQLMHATNFNRAAGIVFGVFKGCDNDKKPTFGLKELLFQLIKPLKIPAVYGMSFGHISHNLTLPYGISASLDAGNFELKLNERAVK
ncbi:MAG: LD-carboxypeptidase [Bacteroidota bacterium]|nr:LD-carboxypeptidase [Bacteroidota bacterium]